jgi:cytochrome c-type biogenesis protein CcmF
VTVELGHFALVLALMVSVIQATVPLVAVRRRDTALMDVGSTAALAQGMLVALSFACLVHAYVVSDFSVESVVLNSHSSKPLAYKVAGTWANHEGSMLLWVLILALFGAALGSARRTLPASLKARALAVQAWIAVGFYAFILLTSNPFRRITPPAADGQGLNPLLQDPALALHPPFLYLGYVGFSLAFSLAVAALLEGRVDAAWARWVRPWTLAAWVFLTVGIALGSGWAYYELGWGGWWFWDPVENASLMPWLSGTALLHSAIVVEKRSSLKGWTVFLAIVTFGLSLLGTFLVRSGVLTSVHAFATDPARGVFILALLLVIVGGAFALFAVRGPQLRSDGMFKPVSREGGLLLNNLFLATAAASVLLGTLYPLILEGIGGDKVSVGPPFFNAVVLPLMAPAAAAMAVAPLLPWKRGDLLVALKRLWLAALAAVAAAVWAWSRGSGHSFLAIGGMALAAWVLTGSLIEAATRLAPRRGVGVWRRARGVPRSAWGTTVAHAGFAVALAGMTGSGLWQDEVIDVLSTGGRTTIGDYVVTFEGARAVDGPNYTATRGTFTITRDGKPVATLEPEKRLYPVERRDTTEAAIDTGMWRDLYVVLGDAQGGDAYVARLYVNPLVAWIWGGASLMVIGGLLSLSDRRYRVGAPAERRQMASGTAVAPAEGA